MMVTGWKRARFIIGILASSLLVACDGSSGGSSGGTGELAISLAKTPSTHGSLTCGTGVCPRSRYKIVSSL